jgi:hypothetical protein
MKPSLKGRALRLLSQREHSRKELEQKLKPHEETPGELSRGAGLSWRPRISSTKSVWSSQL